MRCCDLDFKRHFQMFLVDSRVFFGYKCIISAYYTVIRSNSYCRYIIITRTQIGRIMGWWRWGVVRLGGMSLF